MTMPDTEYWRTVATVDGEQHEAAIDALGHWACPFCEGVNCPGTPLYDNRPWPYPCANHLCIAGGCGDPASVAAIRLERQRRAEGETRRAWLAQRAEEEAAKREQDRLAACEAFGTEAGEKGLCWTCWAKSTRWGLYLGRPKKVRHRDPANCPSQPRRQRAATA
jgi:hypothetical protein